MGGGFQGVKPNMAKKVTVRLGISGVPIDFVFSVDEFRAGNDVTQFSEPRSRRL